MNYDVAAFLSRRKFICNIEMGNVRIRGPRRILSPPFKGEYLEQAWTSLPTPISLKGKPYVPTWLVENIRDTPIMIGGRVHHKSIVRKVTHPSIV